MKNKKITIFLTLPSGEEEKRRTYEGARVAELLNKEYLELVKRGNFILRKKGGEIVPRSVVEYFRVTEGLHLELLPNTPSEAPPMPEPAGPGMKGKQYL